MPIEGSCHCGAVSYVYDDWPKWATDCNCSICRRLGILWIYTKIDNVTITAPPDGTTRYIQGDRTLAMHTCKVCGCTTHYESLDPDKHNRMAVNLRLANPLVVKEIPVRHFDGAETWSYLD